MFAIGSLSVILWLFSPSNRLFTLFIYPPLQGYLDFGLGKGHSRFECQCMRSKMDYGILPLECGQIDYNNKIGEPLLVQAKDILITPFSANKYAYPR